MPQEFRIQTIAKIRSDFPDKFGIPRQSGILKDLKSQIVFEPEFRNADALRGLEEFSHLWIVWIFSENIRKEFHPTVRPPRLGGNVRKGVFATRSPYRPNPLGLSVVRLERIERGVITVSGADIMNGTPIYDIKPYLQYVDSIPNAANGWALAEHGGTLNVEFPEELLRQIPENKRRGLIELLSQDPRPQYQNDPERIYTMAFGQWQISFRVDGERLFVVSLKK